MCVRRGSGRFLEDKTLTANGLKPKEKYRRGETKFFKVRMLDRVTVTSLKSMNPSCTRGLSK